MRWKKDYKNLNSYILNYYNDTRNIKVAFSDKNRPIRDYYFSNENAAISIIKDKKLKIYSYEDIFFVEFYYNNYYLNIETNNISQGEPIVLISSIIKYIKNTPNFRLCFIKLIYILEIISFVEFIVTKTSFI